VEHITAVFGPPHSHKSVLASNPFVDYVLSLANIWYYIVYVCLLLLKSIEYHKRSSPELRTMETAPHSHSNLTNSCMSETEETWVQFNKLCFEIRSLYLKMCSFVNINFMYKVKHGDRAIIYKCLLFESLNTWIIQFQRILMTAYYNQYFGLCPSLRHLVFRATWFGTWIYFHPHVSEISVVLTNLSRQACFPPFQLMMETDPVSETLCPARNAKCWTKSRKPVVPTDGVLQTEWTWFVYRSLAQVCLYSY
jgi:hypothetical protein